VNKDEYITLHYNELLLVDAYMMLLFTVDPLYIIACDITRFRDISQPAVTCYAHSHISLLGYATSQAFQVYKQLQ